VHQTIRLLSHVAIILDLRHSLYTIALVVVAQSTARLHTGICAVVASMLRTPGGFVSCVLASWAKPSRMQMRQPQAVVRQETAIVH
jgi:hypothetical protein